jgi:hypothetical protein
VVVASVGSHEPPAGIGPSVTVRVRVTGPAVVQVKLVDAVVGDENVPLVADHAYVRFAGFGPSAWPTSATA